MSPQWFLRETLGRLGVFSAEIQSVICDVCRHFQKNLVRRAREPQQSSRWK